MRALEKLWCGLGLPILLALLVAVGLTTTPAKAEKRVALVIGNSDYASVPKLPNPTNDANDIEASLKRLNFSVHPPDMIEEVYGVKVMLEECRGHPVVIPVQ